MGTYYKIYLGPYLECKQTKKAVKKTVRSCSNEKCSSYKSIDYGNFCIKCGSKIAKVEYEEEGDSVKAYEVEQKINSNMTSIASEDGKDFWVGNKANKGLRSSCDAEGEGVEEVTADMIAEESERFAKAYAKDIILLKKAYGEGNVALKWGMIQWYT